MEKPPIQLGDEGGGVAQLRPDGVVEALSRSSANSASGGSQALSVRSAFSTTP
jgi:hypothetical protein